MKRSLLIAVFLVPGCFAVRNFVLLSANMVYGGDSTDQLIPRPIYSLARVPSTSITLKYKAAGRIGSDFAQVYFPAQATSDLTDAYIHARTLDPWGRPSRYAPLVILLCSVTICKLDYGYASFLNLMIQILLFYLLLYWTRRRLGGTQYFLPSALFAGLSLFLTPVGLSWFERGQFSLYVASSYLLLMMGLTARKSGMVALAAPLAFVKWTSFPAIFVIFIVYLLSLKDRRELRYGLWNVGIFSLITVVLILFPVLFVRGTGVFLNGLVAQELRDNPTGLSLLKYVPRAVVKLLPVLLILVGYMNIRISKAGFAWLIPYIIGVAALMLIYPTRASDYSVPVLLGFIPLIICWTQQSALQQNSLARGLMYSFFVFILIASFSTQLTHSILTMIGIYIAFSIVFFVSPSVFAKCDLYSRHNETSP